jgi:histidyl-tRNA synthetase
MVNPSIPKGTRDFLPKQMAGRNYIFDTIKTIFKNHGFLQIETPAVENLSTLTGKYGEEGDQLMFKILNRGDKFRKAVSNQSNNESDFTELALKYDQTVPFARFVVQNQNEITFPFKRYQIQPVWRADRPGKGRYREFYQCDVDIVGSDSLLCEVEFIQIYNEVLEALAIPDYTIKINNRKILYGIAEIVGEKEKIIDITTAIDKLDKIGLEKVNEELYSKGVSNDAIDKLQSIIKLSGSTNQKINSLKDFLSKSEIGLKGLEELDYIFDFVDELGLNSSIVLDVTLARGLNYYTGVIFEVESNGFKGSICGGGRYNGLTDQFGLKGIGAAGISFGADRIYDVMLENNLFPKDVLQSLKVFFVNFGIEEERYIMPLLVKLRSIGISSEIYPRKVKMKKQMSYANSKGAEYVVLIGSDEIELEQLSVKNMATGEQEKISFVNFLSKFKNIET